MAGKFLFEVGTSFDTASVDAAVAHYKRAIDEIARGGATPQSAAQLSDVRREASTTLATAQAGGADPAELVAARRQITAAMRSTATALQTSLGDIAGLGEAERATAAALKRVASSAVSTAGRPSVSSLPAAGQLLADVQQKAFVQRTPDQVVEGAAGAEVAAAAAQKLAMARLGLEELAGETAAEREARVAVATRAKVEQERTATARRLAAGEGDDVGPRAQRIAAERLLAEQERLSRVRQSRGLETEEASLIVQRMVEERALNRELNQRVSAELRARQQAGEAGFGGTFFQRLQAQQASRTGGAPRLPEEFGTLGQFAASKAITTAGFALSGAALYGGFSAIKDALEQSDKLQVQMAGLQAQFIATDKAGQFPEFRQAVLDIGRDTATLTTDVAALAPAFVGAFGDGARAAVELRDAVIGIKTNAFTKEDAANISNSLSSTFGVSVREITDQGLHLRDVFGVASDEILQATANLAPVARETGLTFKETSTLIAAAAQTSGRPATAIAEALDRILPDVQKKAADILRIYSQVPSLAPKLPKIAAELGAGDTGRVILDLVNDYSQLDAKQQQQLISAVGGRREAQALISILQRSGLVVKELADNTDTAGRTQLEFSRVMETVKARLAQVREEFRQLGQDLLRAGLGSTLTDLATVGGAVVGMLAALASAMARLNELTHGWAARVLEVVVALRLVQGLVGSGLLTRAASLATAGAIGASAAVPALAAGGAAAGVAGGAAGLGAGAALGGEAAAGGLLAGIGGVALGPVGLAIGATVALSVIASKRAEEKSKGEALRKQLETSDRAALEAAAAQHRSGLSGLIHDIFIAQPDGGDIAREVLAKQDNAPLAQDLKALGASKTVPRANLGERDRAVKELQRGGDFAGQAAAAWLKDSITKDGVDYSSLIAGVNQGNAVAIKAAQALVGQLGKRPGFDPQLASARAELAAQLAQQQQAEAAKSGQTLVSVQEAVSAYQSGDASLGQTLANLHQIISLNELVPNADPSSGIPQALAAARKAESDVTSKALRSAADLRLQLGDIGGTEGPEAAVAEYTKLLEDPRFTSQPERVRVAHDLVKAEQDLLTKTAAEAKSGADRAAVLLKGLPLPEAARAALAAEQVDLSPLIQTFIQEYIRGIAGFDASFSANLAALIAGGASITAALQTLISNQRSKLAAAQAQIQAQVDAFHATQAGPSTAEIGGLDRQAEIDRLDKGLANIPAGLDQEIITPPAFVSSPGGAEAELAKAANSAADNTKSIAAARRALAKALAHGDPVLEAQNELAAANQELADATDEAESLNAQAHIIEAQDALIKALDGISKARLGLVKALQASDPVAAAQIAQAEADLAAQTAHGEAEALQAQTQRVEADRALQHAIADVFNSQTELAIAVANAAGDTVRAAQLGAQEARDKLAQGLASGAGAAEISRLEADVVRANADVVSQKLSTQERNIDFALQIGRITTSQAIAQLQGLLTLVAGNEEQTQRILLKIHELQGATDLQFNIPQEIKLPTLYEARRLNQSQGNYQGNGAPAALNDNRNINLTMIVTKDTDYDGAFKKVSGIVMAPSQVYGTQGSLYTGS